MRTPAFANILGYFLVSALMLNVNKLAINAFKAPYTLTLLQALFTCTAILAAGVRGKVYLSMRDSRRFFLPGTLWALPLAFSMQTLRYINPETVVMFRTFTLIGVSAGDFLFFGKVFIFHELLSLVFICLGGLLYVMSDLQYDAAGYFWGALYCLTMTVSLLVVKAAFNANKSIGVWEKTFYLNWNGSLVFLFLSSSFEGTWMTIERLLALPMLEVFIISISCVLGFWIGFLANAARDALSPTAFDVLSNTSRFLTVTISFSIFKPQYSSFSLCGLALSILGGVVQLRYLRLGKTPPQISPSKLEN